MTAPAWPVIPGAVKVVTFASTPYRVTPGDAVVLINCTAGAVTVVLPPAAGNAGRWITAKKTDVGSTAATVTPSGADTIDGAASATLGFFNAALTFVSSGAGWFTVNTVGQGALGSASLRIYESYLSGIYLNVQAVAFGASPYAQNFKDFYLRVDTAGGAVAVDLLSPIGGQLIAVKKISADANPVTITPAGAGTIDGAPNHVLAAQYDSVLLVGISGAIGWDILSTI